MFRFKKEKKRTRKKNAIILRVSKEFPDVILPSSFNKYSDFDIYAYINNPDGYIEIKPNEHKLIPTGLRFSFPLNYRLKINERGSIGNIPLAVRAGIIDGDYTGEVFIILNNTGNKSVVLVNSLNNKINQHKDCKFIDIKKKAIAHFTLEKRPIIEVLEVSKEVILNIPSERKDGALGSSGR